MKPVGIFLSLLIVFLTGRSHGGDPQKTSGGNDSIHVTAAADRENDKSEIRSLIRHVLAWAASENSIELLPVITDARDSIYTGFSAERLGMNSEKLRATGLFDAEFVENYNRIMATLEEKIDFGEFELWLVGDLPPFNFSGDVNPWCLCQDVPYDNPDPWKSVEIEMIALSDTAGKFVWKWGGRELNKAPVWKDFRYGFRVAKENDTWRIAWLEGFDVKRCTSRAQEPAALRVVDSTGVSASVSAGPDECFNLLRYLPPAFAYHRLEIMPRLSIWGNTSTRENTHNYSDYPDTLISVENSGTAYNPSELGFNAHYGYYGWKRRTEWEIGADVSTTGRLNFEPDDYRENIHPGYAYQSYGKDRGGIGNVNGSFSISAAHYFSRPFFFGVRLGPGARAGVKRTHSIEKSFKYSEPYREIDEDTGIYAYEDYLVQGRNYRTEGIFSLRAGMGHIDDVSFAVAALNMIDRIAETEKTYKGCSARNVQGLAALIEKKYKRRSFDSRTGYIEDIDSLCQFIRESGITDEVSPRTVLEIADQWQYALKQSRSKGYQVVVYPEVTWSREFAFTETEKTLYQLGVAPDYVLVDNTDNEFSSAIPSVTNWEEWTRQQELGYRLNLQMRYERPLSRHYQLSVRAGGGGGINREWESSEDTYRNTYGADPEMMEYRYAIPSVDASESVQLAYYPNTRTALSIRETVEYRRYFDFFDAYFTGYDTDRYFTYSALENDRRELTVSIFGNATYYFSPQLQAGLYLRLEWRDNYGKMYGHAPWPGYYYSTSYLSRVAESGSGFSYTINASVTWKIF